MYLAAAGVGRIESPTRTESTFQICIDNFSTDSDIGLKKTASALRGVRGDQSDTFVST
jgi:hypothetical protein